MDPDVERSSIKSRPKLLLTTSETSTTSNVEHSSSQMEEYVTLKGSNLSLPSTLIEISIDQFNVLPTTVF